MYLWFELYLHTHRGSHSFIIAASPAKNLQPCCLHTPGTLRGPISQCQTLRVHPVVSADSQTNDMQKAAQNIEFFYLAPSPFSHRVRRVSVLVTALLPT